MSNVQKLDTAELTRHKFKPRTRMARAVCYDGVLAEILDEDSDLAHISECFAWATFNWPKR